MLALYKISGLQKYSNARRNSFLQTYCVYHTKLSINNM